MSSSSTQASERHRPRARCAVLIEKDESPGMLKFRHERLSVKESQGKVLITVERVGGSHGASSASCAPRTARRSPTRTTSRATRRSPSTDGETSSTLPIYIVDDDVYEADETFQVVLSEPEGGATFDPTSDGAPERAVATVTIISDEQVRRKVDELAALVAFNADDALLSANTWAEQFKEAVEYEGEGPLAHHVPARPAVEAHSPSRRRRASSAAAGSASSSSSPSSASSPPSSATSRRPPRLLHGPHGGITAITFVALGTSLPDTFASKTAAQSEPYADASIGNITGSNSVNGSSASASHRRARLRRTACALVCLGFLVFRRAVVGYELGGPPAFAYLTGAFFVGLWFVYITMSVLYTMGYFH